MVLNPKDGTGLKFREAGTIGSGFFYVRDARKWHSIFRFAEWIERILYCKKNTNCLKKSVGFIDSLFKLPDFRS